MRGVLVIIPDPGVVAVGNPEPRDPVLPASVTAPFGHDPSHEGRRTNIELQPLIRCSQRMLRGEHED